MMHHVQEEENAIIDLLQWSFRLKALFLFMQVWFPYFQKASNAELYPRNRKHLWGLHSRILFLLI
jgi:hypothetical protein